MADALKALRKVKSVYILQDNQTFGKGVAQGFQARAKKIGIKVLGFEAVERQGDRLHGHRAEDQGLARHSPSTSGASSATTA